MVKVIASIVPILLVLAGWPPTAVAQTTETPVEDGSVSGVPPGLTIFRDVCVDPDRAGAVHFTVRPLLDNWNARAAPTIFAEPRTPPRADGPLATAPLIPCRYARAEDGPMVYTLTNLETGERERATIAPGEMEVSILDPPTGAYRLSEEGGAGRATSEAFRYDADAAPVLLVLVHGFTAERDWTPPAEDPEDLGQINFVPYRCEANTRAPNVLWFDKTFGVVVVGAGPGFVAPAVDVRPPSARQATGKSAFFPAGITSSCALAGSGDVVFEVVPLTPAGERGEPVPVVPTPDGRFTTDWIPEGEYQVSELTTATTVGSIYLVAGHDINFFAYAEAPTTP